MSRVEAWEGIFQHRMNRAANSSSANPVRNGHGHIRVENVADESAVTASCTSSPLKILIPRPRGESVWAYLSSFGGGLVAGDETRLDIELGERTRCFLSTQAATKIYRNPDGRPCSHHLNAKVGAGSLLVLAPDPVQAFAGSQYLQRQEFRLAAGSGLVLVDWLNAGRAARGERWAFNRFHSRNEVFFDGRRAFLDSLLLDPADGPPLSNHRLGRFNCIALVLISGALVNEAAQKILADIAARPVAKRAQLICSASAISGGVVVRLAGESAEAVGHEIQRLLDFLPALLHDDPWSRKW